MLVLDRGSVRSLGWPGNLLGPVRTMSTNALHDENGSARGAKAKAGGNPARFCNEAKSHFRSNPKGTGALGRHSALLSSLRRSVFSFVKRLDCRPMPPVRFR